MKTIWKYPIVTGPNRQFAIDMPVGAQVLSVQYQQETACIWALVNPRASVIPFRFRVVGTGIPIALNLAGWEFLDTLQEGRFVWHVFQEKLS